MSIFNKQFIISLYRRIAKSDSIVSSNKTTGSQKSMFKQSYNKDEFKDAETVIGPSVMIKGNFNSQGNIVIEGILKGDVKTASNIFIGDNAKVTANIDAKTARAGGEVNGNMKIKGHLEIVASAKIHGDIECGSLAVENGAIINGKIIMSHPEATKETPITRHEEGREEKKEEK